MAIKTSKKLQAEVRQDIMDGEVTFPASSVTDTAEKVIMTSDERPVVARAAQVAGCMGIETTGRPVITNATVNACNFGTYVFADPVEHTAVRHTLRVRNAGGAARTLQLCAFILSGGNFQPAPDAEYIAVEIPIGTHDLPVALLIRRGEHFGFAIAVTGAVSYSIGLAGDSGGYYYNAAIAPTGPVAAGVGTISTIQLDIGIDCTFALAGDDAIDALQPSIDATADAVAALQPSVDAAAVTGAKLTAITETLVIDGFSQTAPSYSNFVTGTPSCKGWAPGFLGTSLPEGAIIEGFAVTLHRGATVATFEARLFSRPIETTALPSGADTAEWGDWVSVDASTVAVGAFGVVAFTGPAEIENDQSKAYYLHIRAKDTGGNLVDFACGNTGNGAGLNQVQRGYYRNGGNSAWDAVGGTTIALNITVKTSELRVAQSALPPVEQEDRRPSKKRATMIMMGRTALAFDNSGLHTFRRVFAVPANVARVHRVVFAHSGATPLVITRAAIAPLASAANFAAAGAAWTPLAFGSGDESGAIPSRPGASRFGWLASRDNPVDLVNRTDVPGAAKLVVVSAYAGGGGTLTLLGSATDNDNYRTYWEARSDFPSVMRRNVGDCVTTPASFTSTDNQKSGTFIAGIEVECDDGELMTIGFVGDSITNGAGVSSGGDGQYGLGWAENAAYALNTKTRGVVSQLLGWSGQNMTNIRYLATDWLDFCAAENIQAPNMLFAPNASPNSIAAPITQPHMDAQRLLSDEILSVAVGAGVVPISWTIIPTNPSVKDYNASDSIRRDYNDADRAEASAANGLFLADMDAAMVTSIDGDGQAISTKLPDGIHPGTDGYEDMASVAIRAAKRALPAAGYAEGGLVL